MRTRLLSEQLIRKRFPHLRYVRVHTHGKNAATIYAWNDDLQLPHKEIRSLKLFASDHLHPYVCFKVKSYNMVQSDRVPQAQELPQSVINSAMSRKLDQDEIVTLINRLFSYGQLTFNRYDSTNAIIHFDFHSTVFVNQIDKELIYHYLCELIPLGSSCEVAFY
ncbi:hypothetical protein [Paenibacillus radicis (ex Xue et al. 2023)]|uniref:Uncharacterized protein n=1 Tax=Paenibacillus radicis (ex Xue et al. 2023) TaxID=2972489 RepID=A0ABT1YEC5_9BACL|nr:hypothetical protein [Paenibacillus radicis (ex Xue et al. 2023)]MCR8631534.1 hypothetical protein [Paenibacillus radicis (ex Xue et al. 2023)]